MGEGEQTVVADVGGTVAPPPRPHLRHDRGDGGGHVVRGATVTAGSSRLIAGGAFVSSGSTIPAGPRSRRAAGRAGRGSGRPCGVERRHAAPGLDVVEDHPQQQAGLAGAGRAETCTWWRASAREIPTRTAGPALATPITLPPRPRRSVGGTRLRHRPPLAPASLARVAGHGTLRGRSGRRRRRVGRLHGGVGCRRRGGSGRCRGRTGGERCRGWRGGAARQRRACRSADGSAGSPARAAVSSTEARVIRDVRTPTATSRWRVPGAAGGGAKCADSRPKPEVMSAAAARAAAVVGRCAVACTATSRCGAAANFAARLPRQLGQVRIRAPGRARCGCSGRA